MKKFLSLVLTLALVMSLVVIPANADDPVIAGTYAVTASDTVARGSDITFIAAATTPTVDGQTAKVTGHAWEITSGSDCLSGTVGATNTQTYKAIKAGSVTVQCTFTLTYTPDQATSPTTITKTATKTITVSDKFLASDVTSVTVLGRTYNVTNGAVTVSRYPNETLPTDTGWTAVCANGYSFSSAVFNGTNQLTVTATGLADPANIAVTVATPSVTVAGSAYQSGTSNKTPMIVTDGRVELTATATAAASNATYTWSYNNGSTDTTIGTGRTQSWTPNLAAGSYTVKCTVNDGVGTMSDTLTLTIVASTYSLTAINTNTTLEKGNTCRNDTYVNFSAGLSSLCGVTYTSSNSAIARVDNYGTVTAVDDGTANITVSGYYMGKLYTVAVPFTVRSMSYTLGSVVNGDSSYYYNGDLKSAVISAIRSVNSYFSGSESNITAMSITTVPSSTQGYLYYDGNYSSSNRLTNGASITDKNLYFEATKGYLGTISLPVNATISGTSYEVTLKIPVVSSGSISEEVNAVKSGTNSSSYEFTVDSGYTYLYYTTTSSSAQYENYKSWTRKTSGQTIALTQSNFNSDGKAVLYVVGVDSYGVATSGTITVYQKLYDFEYRGVIGSSTAFKHSDFTSYLESAAKSANRITSSGYTTLTSVKFTIPSTTSVGDLYYNGTRLTSSSTECTNMDNVSFTPASKAAEKIYINFTVTGKAYSSSSTSTGSNVSYSGRILVTIQGKNIEYKTGVGGSVTFSAYDFQSFYRSAKGGTLNYVLFTKLPNSLTEGTLYGSSYYNALGSYKTALKTSDKAYYSTTNLTGYDLSSVTFDASTVAAANSTIYIPFTAYGTSGTTTGWLAVTLSKEMKFTDVKSYDWYYTNLNKAYGMGLIDGYEDNTFRAGGTMTYAEAIVLACRMNQLYYDKVVTLKSSTTGNWYSSYMTYALQKGIISADMSSVANQKITRKAYVDIFYNALPASAYTSINTISKIPDLTENTANAHIYAFYRAGILTGYTNTAGKTNYSFGPNDNITRAEVATILIRMMDSSSRQYIRL